MTKFKCSALAILLLALHFSSIPVARAADTPNSAAPTISVDASGKNISYKTGTWSGGAVTASWIVNGKATPGAAKKVLPAPSKKGTSIQLRETSSGVSALSNRIVIGNVIVNGFTKISYVDDKQTTLSATVPTTFPKASTAKYQWLKGPFEIKGAHSSTYVLATGDQGSDISVRVTFTGKGFGTTTQESTSVAIPVATRSYALAWSDEFNAGSPLNPKIWKTEDGDGVAYNNRGWGNQERQYYLSTQSTIDSSGALTMAATRKGAETIKCYYAASCEWISSKFVTKGLVGFKYGRIETRVKGPIGAGTWAAFWMLGANIDDRPWPGCGEIDITELLGRDPSTVYGTPHGPASGQSYTTTLANGFASEYHTYAVDWLPDQITWYVDGKAYGSHNKSELDDPSHTWVFDHEYYLLANLAMGGTFGGAIDPALQDATTSFDYVRFYTINGLGEVINH